MQLYLPLLKTNLEVEKCEKNKLRLRWKWFPGFRELLAEVKAMVRAHWLPDEEGKPWEVDDCERNWIALEYLQGKRKLDPLSPVEINSASTTRGYLLFDHQKKIAAFELGRKRCIIVGEMGVGKTLPTLHVIRAIKGKTLVVAPNGAILEWMRQIRKFDFRDILSYTDFTTYESIHKADHSVEVLVLDESVKIKNPVAARSINTKCVADCVRARDGYIILLSGAPTPKDPTDLWNQIELISPGYIRESDPRKLSWRLAEWRDGPFGKELVKWKEDEVTAFSRRIKPLTFVLRKAECFDLPPKIFDVIECECTPEYIATARSVIENIDEAALALTKLRELSDGFMYTDRGETITIENSPKEKALTDLLEFYRENEVPRIVIYAGFDASIKKCYHLAFACGWESYIISGKHMPDVEAFDRFLSSDPKPMAFICYPGCIYGLNFCTSPVLVYYSNTFSGDHRMQSLERCDRPGHSGQSTRIIDLVHLASDRLVLENLALKGKLSDITLEEIKQCLKEQPQFFF